MKRELACVLAAAALLLAACSARKDPGFQGWVEADLIFVGPDETGRVQTLEVREGDPVTTGQLVLTLDDDLQQADVAQKTATVTNARQTLDRAQALLKVNAGTQKAYDDAQQVQREADALLNSSRTRLARRRVFSPVTGSVQQVYYRPGEMVPVGKPVVALLPPENLKIRFFVSEPALAGLAIGDRIDVHCDGCLDTEARISFIARSAEFTPPVIYSLDERAKLVFLVEARTVKHVDLRVGQPVNVSLRPKDAATAAAP